MRVERVFRTLLLVFGFFRLVGLKATDSADSMVVILQNKKRISTLKILFNNILKIF